ncbi:MAG: biotin transporter BioY [Dehalococcoidia bacterium]
MEVVTTLNRYKYEAFRWRYEASWAKKLALALGMACVTGLVAQLRIQLPWSPVPIVGTHLGIFLAAVLLGRWWGGASIAIYAALGFAGVPWFAGLSGGVGVLVGATGGYIIGFIPAALFVGYFTDRYIRARSFLTMFGLMLFASYVLIYVPGLLGLGMWLHFVQGEAFSLWQLLWMGAIPFIPGDAIKSAIIAAAARGITPKVAYNGEVDRGRKFWRVP